MVAMSARCGTLDRVSVRSVSRAAAISGRAAFLAPPIGMEPSSGLPPRNRIGSINSLIHKSCRPRGSQTTMRDRLSSAKGRESPERAAKGTPVPAAASAARYGAAGPKSELRQGDAALAHIFAGAVPVAGLAGLVAL